MPKFRMLVTAFLVVGLLVVALSTIVSAQLPPALYRVTVYDGGSLVGPGRTVDAYVGVDVAPRASGLTDAWGVCILQVPVTIDEINLSEALRFQVDGVDAIETPDVDVTMAAPDVRLDIAVDPCNPTTVDDLRVTGMGPDSIDLTWTAPGEDPDGTGTCTDYDVRYAMSPILTEADWAAATDAVGEPAPSAPGSTETFTVTGLTPDTTYWFAVKAEDDVGKLSNLSNSPSGTTGTTGGGLGGGWNLLSTPVTLESDGGQNAFGQIVDPADVLAAYRFYGNRWYPVTAWYVLKPLEGIYVNVVTGGTAATFVPEDDITAPPTRNLNAGWSVIGPAPANTASFLATPVMEALACMITGGMFGEVSFSNVISPALNQPGWTFNPWYSDTEPDMLPYKGYWVYMETNDILVGYSTTPLTP